MVNIARINFSNRVMPASGTLAYTDAYSPYINFSKLGAIVTKAVTFDPRAGNPPPRLMETEKGIINHVGLQNKGVKYFLEKELTLLTSHAVPIIVNIAGSTEEEYLNIVKLLSPYSQQISGIEVNVSCPNVKEGCLAFGESPSIINKLVSSLRKATEIPLIIKLTPNAKDIVGVAQSAVDAGADALTLINTVKVEENGFKGGLSGPAIRPLALRLIEKVKKVISIPVIGVGGICCKDDVVSFLSAGATCVQIGTAAMIRPWLLEKLGLQFRE